MRDWIYLRICTEEETVSARAMTSMINATARLLPGLLAIDGRQNIPGLESPHECELVLGMPGRRNITQVSRKVESRP